MDDQTAAGGNTAKSATILVVDDDVQTVEVVQQALRSSQAELLTARSAAEARQILAEHEPALIMLNLVLPDADGRNVLSELRQDPRTAGIPVVVVLGFWGPQPRDECLRLGANEVLEKPLDEEPLGATFSRALSQTAVFDEDPLHDAVTGLPSRAALAEAYSRATADAKEAGRPLTIALLDLDGLSRINENHGRDAGDAVLRNVASRIVTALRDTDVVSRWEEDEYVTVFPLTDLSTARRLLTKAQESVGSSPAAQQDGAEIPITFSAGLTTVPPEAPLEEAVARADGVLLRAKADGPSNICSSEDEAPASVPTLLVAEDDRVAAALVRHRLERAGFEVLHRDNGAEALDTALGNDISLFVLDIRMPGMDGIELLKRLRESEPYAQTPILMLTSMGREEDIVRAFKLGASDYLTKPFSPVELLARVQRLLRRGSHTA
jgi:diguanylate cyclase (GGDEF)-like protein